MNKKILICTGGTGGHVIPAVNFGPGDPLLAHTSNEFVNKNQILESYKLLLTYLKSYR